MSVPHVRYCPDDDASTKQNDDTQLRQYQLLEKLQNLVHKLPIKVQQRLSYSLLSDVAAVLLDEAVFTIVGDLKEIQHLTEKNLNGQRQKLLLDHKARKQKLKSKLKEEIQNCRPHNLSLLKNEHEKQKKELDKKLQLEIREIDERLLLELDEKVADQQSTMQSAGIPAFYVTKDPKEIKLQMTIFQLILDLNPT